MLNHVWHELCQKVACLSQSRETSKPISKKPDGPGNLPTRGLQTMANQGSRYSYGFGGGGGVLRSLTVVAIYPAATTFGGADLRASMSRNSSPGTGGLK